MIAYQSPTPSNSLQQMTSKLEPMKAILGAVTTRRVNPMILGIQSQLSEI
jgi:hypothetical protein